VIQQKVDLFFSSALHLSLKHGLKLRLANDYEQRFLQAFEGCSPSRVIKQSKLTSNASSFNRCHVHAQVGPFMIQTEAFHCALSGDRRLEALYI